MSCDRLQSKLVKTVNGKLLLQFSNLRRISKTLSLVPKIIFSCARIISILPVMGETTAKNLPFSLSAHDVITNLKNIWEQLFDGDGKMVNILKT